MDGEVLGEDEDGAAIDEAASGDDAVSGDLVLGHAKVLALVCDEAVNLFKGAGVKEEVDPFSGGHFSFFMLSCDALRPTSFKASGPKLCETFDARVDGVMGHFSFSSFLF